MKRLLALVPIVAFLLALPATAGAAITFGADLSQPVLNIGGCPRDAFLVDQGGPSCLITTASSTTSMFAPASGTVDTVRVKTGDVPQGTGQMQLVVERSFFQNNPNSPGHPNFFCCFIQQYGPVFTPQRNTINTITNANLSFVEQPTPAPDDFNTAAKGDFLALSVLGSDVPLPAGQDAAGFLTYVTPAPVPGNPSAPSLNPYGGNSNGEAPGLTVMMNADLEPLGSDGGGGGGGGNIGGGAQPQPQPQPQPPVQPLTIGGGNVVGNRAAIPLTCALDTTCVGLLQLLDRAAGAAHAARKPAVLGKAHFSVPAHSTAKVKVKLTSAGKKLLRRKGKVRVVAKATVGGRVTTSTVTLRRKSGKH